MEAVQTVPSVRIDNPHDGSTVYLEINKGGAIKIKFLREALKELEQAHARAKVARDGYKEIIDAVAERSGLDASVVRAYVTARMLENMEQAEKKSAKAQQLALVFDEVGL